MLTVENVETYGWEAAIRGMRNPMNSWDRSDSIFDQYLKVFIGPKDLELMRKLIKGGDVHAKFMRMITVAMDITAPLYWWKEFDTYKVGTVANSCSTMHKIHSKEFTMDDFSTDHIIKETDTSEAEWDGAFTKEECEVLKDKYCCIDDWDIAGACNIYPDEILQLIIKMLNRARELYIKTKDKKYWWQMIQLLPSSYNQKRTVQANYQVLRNMYHWRKDHKLDEWHVLCDSLKELPYGNELICDLMEDNKCS